MQSPHDFIREYLTEQVRIQEVWRDVWLPVRHRFFQPGCTLFDPQRNIDRAKAETPLETSESGPGTAVVTTSGFGEGLRLRYTLQNSGEAWRINRVEMECNLCQGTGTFRTGVCKWCKGDGWKEF